MPNISVIGLGAIGLPLSILLCKNGQKVNGYDIDKLRLEKIKDPKKSYFDNDIYNVLIDAKVKKNFILSATLVKAEVYIICVPTPIKAKSNNKYSADLKFLDLAIKNIKKNLKPKDLIIIESTIPVKTCLNIIKSLNNKDVYIAHSPERAFPGNTINEMIYNDRIIGSNTKLGLKKTVKVYRKFVKSKIICTDLQTAEACKLVENSFRDVNIALANELNYILSNNKLNVKEIFKLANMHPRVSLHNYGIGVGGHCLPVDPYFLPDFYKSTILKNSRRINDSTTDRCIKKIKNISIKNESSRIVLLGLTYKENCNDIRNSPALSIFNSLSKKFKNIHACDPHFEITNNTFNKKNIMIMKTVKKSDILILLVNHKAFNNLLIKMKKQFISIL